MAPRKVLFLIGSFRNGGAEKSLTQVLTHLDRSRFSPEAACFEPGGRYFPDVEALGIPVHVLNVTPPLVSPRNVRPLLRLSRHSRKAGIDLIHSYLVAANIVAAVVSRMAGVPFVGGLRSTDALKSGRFMAAHLFALRRSVAMVAVSDAVKSSYVDRGLAGDRIRVIENGVDIPDRLPDRGSARARLGLGPGDLAVTTVATLTPEKDHVGLLDAAARVRARFPDAKFLWAGGGRLEKELRERIHGAGMTDTVRLLGHVDDVPGLLAASDLFCLSSVVEGMSNALLEAMAGGLPAVVTDAGSNATLVVDGETGRVVPPGRPADLAAAIGHLLADRDLLRECGRKARRRAEEHYSTPRMVARLESFYEALLSPDGPA